MSENPILKGLREHQRPELDIQGGMSFWVMRRAVDQCLRKYGFHDAAAEFRYLAEVECEGDNGMLFTLALNYIRVPGQEPVNGW